MNKKLPDLARLNVARKDPLICGPWSQQVNGACVDGASERYSGQGVGAGILGVSDGYNQIKSTACDCMSKYQSRCLSGAGEGAKAAGRLFRVRVWEKKGGGSQHRISLAVAVRPQPTVASERRVPQMFGLPSLRFDVTEPLILAALFAGGGKNCRWGLPDEVRVSVCGNPVEQMVQMPKVKQENLEGLHRRQINASRIIRFSFSSQQKPGANLFQLLALTSQGPPPRSCLA